MGKEPERFPACLRFTLAGVAVAVLLNFLAFQDSDLARALEVLESPFIQFSGFLRHEFQIGPRGEAWWLFQIAAGASQWPFLGLVADGIRWGRRRMRRAREAEGAGPPGPD